MRLRPASLVLPTLLALAFSVHAAESPPQAEEAPDRKRNLDQMAVRSNRWRLTCVRRLRERWLPRLRRLTGARVDLKTEQSGTSANIDIQVHAAGASRGIHVFWDPDECDAGGPNGGWIPDGFDWRAPKSELEQLLSGAGNDCPIAW